MESHVFNYVDVSVNIDIKDLNQNSTLSFVKDYINNIYEAKGINVAKLAKKADTVYAKVLKSSNGDVIKSSSHTNPGKLEFEYFAYSQVSGQLMDAIDKKMINGLCKLIFDVYCFNPDGSFYEPIDFTLNGDASTGIIDADLLCGFSYNDHQISQDSSTWIDGLSLSGLSSGTYNISVRSRDTSIFEIRSHEITI